MSQNEIATSRHFSKSSVNLVLQTAKKLDVTAKDLQDMSEEEVYHLFFPDKLTADQIYELPDYDYVHEELKKVGVNLKLLWGEYRDKCLEKGTLPVGKTKFCDDYNKFCDENAISAHYEHKRIASHTKFPDYVTNRYRTEKSHMPDFMNEPEMNDVRMLSWAATIGPYTKEVISRVFRGVMADAIMDRIVHNSDTVDLGKVNMRHLLARKEI